TGGRAWNYSLLLTAGKRFVTVDDDMICQPRWSPDYQQELKISARSRETRFLLDRDDLLARTRPLEVDPIKQHEDRLGYSLGKNIRCLSTIKFNERSLEYLSSDLVATVDENSPVLLT